MLKNFINEENYSNESYETPFINLFPFDFQYNKQQDLEEAEYIKLYFIEKKDTKETSSIHENESKALIFIITKEKEKEFGNEFLNRKRKQEENPKIHSIPKLTKPRQENSKEMISSQKIKCIISLILFMLRMLYSKNLE